MPSRIRRSRTERVRLFERAHGICSICGCKIQVGEPWHLDHIVPLEDSGADNDTNIGPAHTKCHLEKTATEATSRAKTRRMHANHIGASGPGRSASPLPCGRRSKLKKTLLHGVVIRRSQSELYRELMRERWGREI